MNELQLKLCDIQGRLFELTADKHYGSAVFIKKFMNSNANCKHIVVCVETRI